MSQEDRQKLIEQHDGGRIQSMSSAMTSQNDNQSPMSQRYADSDRLIPETPRTPTQKLGHIIASPARMVAKQVAPGSIKASVFSLIIICLGAGTIAIPYVFYENGIFLGIVFIFFGGSLSLFTGHLIAVCAAETGGESFEGVAQALFGLKGMRFTSFCNIICNLGFLLSYQVLLKTTMPTTLERFGAKGLPDWMLDNKTGQRFWITLFCFIVLLPASLPRDLGALRFSSLFSFMISIFIVISIFSMSFTYEPVDEPNQQFSLKADTALHNNNPTLLGMFNSLPLIIFSYMYQPLIPAIYHELKDKSVAKIDKVLCIGTTFASIAYIVTGIFGYITFANHTMVKELMEKRNVLDCYGPDVVLGKVCLLGILIIVLFASPFCVLPSKDSFEELLMPQGKKFSFKQNLLCTFGIIVTTWFLSLWLDTLGQVMTLLGATTNSGIGFLIPIVFYLKLLKNKETESQQLFGMKDNDQKSNKRIKIICYITFVLVCICSCIELYSYVVASTS